MIPVRKKIEIQEGVTVDLLFTPHLYSYKGTSGVSFDIQNDKSLREMEEVYADIFYCAGLNAWELDGHGTVEDFPFTRGDFHALMTADPEAFRKNVSFALRALTGKTLEEFSAEAKPATEEGDAGKKKRSGWIGRLWRRSSSASAGKRNERRP